MARLWPGGWWGRAAPISKQQGRRSFSSTHTGTGGWCYTDPDDKDSVTQCKDEDDYDLCKTFHPGVKAVVTVSRIHAASWACQPTSTPTPPQHPHAHTCTPTHTPNAQSPCTQCTRRACADRSAPTYSLYTPPNPTAPHHTLTTPKPTSTTPSRLPYTPRPHRGFSS